MPVMTMPLSNKALQMDPHASRFVSSVTEYSASRGSSGFSKEPWPGMDPFDQLLDLRQGSSSIEEYITQFGELPYRIPFDDVVLKYFFCFGLSEPIKSWIPKGKFNCSLEYFMDYTLLCADSLFTVSIADENRQTASMTEMLAAPENGGHSNRSHQYCNS